MKEKNFKKVLLLGSGAIKIGEAGEFDYSGSQALKALKEECAQTILVNPNIATVQTSESMADKIYFLPIEPYFVEKIINKEKPDGILCTFGGQTALNCAVELERQGILKKNKVKVLGTPIEAVINTEDRDLFIKKLAQIPVKYPISKAVKNIEDAIRAAKNIGYPIMTRIAYALGGLGSGIANNQQELINIADRAFSYTKQILIEEYLFGWKEIEYEVLRDKHDNCITVCNMENFDPMGVHTGESIVVAPSQTLTNDEYHKLRRIAIEVIRAFNIIGECNIQFAYNPKTADYRIIEVNARLSRSSALASKATGYPLALVAAKLALGHSLPQLKNSITKVTSACFEPALDYVVVKIPRWDFKKFNKVTKKIDSSMMSVGEVMAIGRKFEEALQKALRMLDIGAIGLVSNKNMKFRNINEELKNPSDLRIFSIAKAIKSGKKIEDIYRLTKIDKWFLYKIRNICIIEESIKKYEINNLPKRLIALAKGAGFSDKQIAVCLNHKAKALDIKRRRQKFNVLPCVKQIDTLAAEYPAKTNYLYLSYGGRKDDVKFTKKKKIFILGSGSYRIGSSVEFDWCCVNAAYTLKKLGYETVMINYNPETVSTDYDECDRLYFEELSIENLMDLYGREQPDGIMVSVGGQIPNSLALKLNRAGAKIIGTCAESIDNAEDRHKFSKLLDHLNIDQPQWKKLTSLSQIKKFAQAVGYPVLVRPSYVLSGAAMRVAYDYLELKDYLIKATELNNNEFPVVISKFISDAKEIEIDAVAKNGDIIVQAITEHVEKAGVHSGDATLVFPAQNLYIETIRRIKEISKKIAKALDISGPFNIQFIAKDKDIKVIECNLRASRSFPFVSKVMKTNFIDIAVKAMLSKKIKINNPPFKLKYVGVKYPQFSFARLKGADPVTSVEMASTGEVAALGKNINEAFLKSAISSGISMPRKNILLSIGDHKNKQKLLNSAKKIAAGGYNIFATNSTSDFLKKNNITNTRLDKNKIENLIKYIKKNIIDLAIIIPSLKKREAETKGYNIRRTAVDFAVPLITDVDVAKLFVSSITKLKLNDLEIKSWDEYEK